MGQGLHRDRGRARWTAAARTWVVWAVCSVGAAMGTPPAMAQTGTDGSIGGNVLSDSGAPVAGALVVVRGTETGLELRARSGTRGEFLVVRLPVGEYEVRVQSAGAVVTLPRPVVVRLGEVTEVEARMPAHSSPDAEAGAVAAGEADAPEGNRGDLIELPVNGGEWRSLVLAASGANGAADADDASGAVSFRGVAVTQNSSRTDGISGDESFGGARAGAGVEEEGNAGADTVLDLASGVGSGAGSVVDGGRRAGSSYTFAQGAVREFRVEGQGGAATYGSALYGHGVGGVVTTVSRSGETRLHGMAFYTARQSAWAAVNPFSVASSYANGMVTNVLVKPQDDRQQFGGRVGGPIGWNALKNTNGRGSTRANASFTPRLFYFYAFDAQRRNFPAISSPGYAGFYALTATQTALLGNRGVSSAKTVAALNYLDSLTGTVVRQSDQTVNFGRLDWQRRGGSRVVLEYNRAQWSEPAGARSAAVVDRGTASLGSSYGAVDAGVARWVQFLGRGLSNEVRVQDGRQLQYEAAQTPLAQEPNVGPGGMPPEVSIGPNGLVFGTPASLGQRAYPDERRMEIADVLAWVKGRQFVQMGGDFSLVRDFTDSLADVEGTFSYDSGVTGGKAGGLVDWITDYTFNVNAYPNGGCPSIVSAVHDFCFRSYAQSFGQQSLTFNTQEWAGFVQDDWRVATTLTVHAGLRYEYEQMPLPQMPNAALDAAFGGVGATSAYPKDRNNFGPRLGVAWQPFGVGRGSVRIGYGVYYGKLPGATVRAALLDTAMPGSTISVRILPATETLCPQRAEVGFGYPCSYLAAPVGVVAATTSAVVFDRRFRLPAVQQGTLTLEHTLGGGLLGSVGYGMNLDRQLPDSVDVNIAPSTDAKLFQLQGGTGAIGVRSEETFVVPVYSERVSTSFGPVTDMVSNGNATYNGLTVEARRGLGSEGAGYGGVGRGMEFRVAWTWSKAIDYGQNAGATPRTNGQFDPFTVRYDRGLSALDFSHRVVGTWVWSPHGGGYRMPAAGERELPAAIDRALRAATDGWSLAGIFSEASGRRYSYDVFGGTRLAGGHESLNGSGGSVVLPTVGRNTLRLPDTANLDLRLSRSLKLRRDGLRLRASAEVFNAFNHLNYSGVQQRAFLVGTPVSGVTPLVFQDAATVASEGLNVQPFGTYTAAGTSQARERQVQLGLRLEF
jgi:hypothetical protein